MRATRKGHTRVLLDWTGDSCCESPEQARKDTHRTSIPHQVTSTHFNLLVGLKTALREVEFDGRYLTTIHPSEKFQFRFKSDSLYVCGVVLFLIDIDKDLVQVLSPDEAKFKPATPTIFASHSAQVVV